MSSMKKFLEEKTSIPGKSFDLSFSLKYQPENHEL